MSVTLIPASSHPANDPLDPLDAASAALLEAPQGAGAGVGAAVSQLHTPPTTPPNRKRVFALVPQTPGAKRARFSLFQPRQPLFKGEEICSDEQANDGTSKEWLDALQLSAYLNVQRQYTLPSGRQCTIIKQITTQGCAAASLLMLCTDAMRRGDDLPTPDTAFSRWIAQCTSTNFRNLTEKAALFQLTLKDVEITKEDSLEEIHDKIESSTLSVIASIEHPTLSGHYILIDEVDLTGPTAFVYIRDPFSGKAYKVEGEEARQWFKTNSAGRFLYVDAQVGP